MAAVTIGVDPHKGSHTAVAVGTAEEVLGQLRVRAGAAQARQLLRPGACLPVRPDDHASVLKIWAKRHRDLSRARNQVVCRLHAVLCDLVPGGVSKNITAGQATRILDRVQPRGAAGVARWILAEQFLTDLRRTGTQRSDVKKKLATAVKASGTTVCCRPALPWTLLLAHMGFFTPPST
jgi:hypothetical protein